MIETISNNQTNSSVQVVPSGADSKTIAALTKRIDDVQADVTELQNCCSEVRESISGIDGDIEDLNTWHSQNVNRITALEGDVNDLREQIQDVTVAGVPRGIDLDAVRGVFYDSQQGQLFDLPSATSTTAGLLSSSDKIKLNEFASLYNNVTMQYGVTTGSRVRWFDSEEIYRFDEQSTSIRAKILKSSSAVIQRIELHTYEDGSDVVVEDQFTPTYSSNNEAYVRTSVSTESHNSIQYWWVITIDGKQYESDKLTITSVAPVYYGFAEDVPAISDLTQYNKPISSFDNQQFTSTNRLGTSGKLFIAVPTAPFVDIQSVTSNGYPAYYEKLDAILTEDYTDYYIYRIGSTYSNGTEITITIN